YVDPGQVQLSIATAEVAGKTFEDLQIDHGVVTSHITDTIDTVNVSMTATDVKENAESVFTVHVSQALTDDLTV
ncbi:hypothetical protein, partial [Geomonas anaerohicana]